MIVRNITGTRDRSCNCCNTWKGHWEKMHNKNARNCSRKGCSNKADVGAHVVRTIDSTWRIVPLCHKCNRISANEWFELNKGVQTVSADHFSCE